MAEENISVIDRAFIEGTPIDNAIKRAMRKAAIMHKKMGNPVYASKNGVVYQILAEDIVIPEAPPEDEV